MKPASPTKTRLKSIDLLRGIAVILVMFSHYNIAPYITKGAWIGVDLFFVLSGFLVSGLLFSEYKKYGNIKIKHFLIRRGFKIYPSFYAFIIIMILYFYFTGKEINTNQLVGELFFLQNYIGGMMGHTWTLAVEEHFYIVMPLLLALLLRIEDKKPFKKIPIIFIMIAILLLSLRIYNNLTQDYSDFTHHYPSHLRVDSMFFGVLLSYYFHFNNDRLFEIIKNNYIRLLAALFLTLPFIFNINTFFINTFGLTLIYISFGIVLINFIICVEFSKKNMMINSISLIGFYSYSIYLWHLPIRNLFLSLARKFEIAEVTLWGFLIYMITSIIVGILLSKLIEMYFLRIRDKYFPSRSKSLSP